MKSIWKKIETASPEEAAQLRAALLHQLWKSAFFALSAVAVVAFATIAWFASNSQVHSGTAAISSGFEPIKLATKGDDDGYYRQTADKYLSLPDDNEVKTLDYADDTYYYTDGDPIALRLDAKDYEVSPGARGKVTFYVIPANASGSVTLQIGLGGYGEDENDNNKVKFINDPVLNALLSGHILLFHKYDAEHNTYSDWLFQDGGDGIFNNAINVELSGKEAGVPVPVDFYWIWPLRYENMKNDLAEVESFIEDQADFEKMTPLGESKEGYRYSRIFLTKNNTARSTAYDLADEYIGSNAQYLYLTIQTSASNVTEGGQQP